MTVHASGFLSTAIVEVDRPSRYAKQLASHMNHKAQSTQTSEGWELFFNPARATLVPRGGVDYPALEMTVWSPTREGLESVQGALERHLQKFTARIGGLEVVWEEG